MRKQVVRWAVTLLATAAGLQAQTISFTGAPLSENFNSMGTNGTVTPSGWYVASNAGTVIHYTTNVTVSAGTVAVGGGIRGFNLGASNATDRALGVGPTGSDRYLEARFVNNTMYGLAALTISYTGEEWRTGSATTTNSQLVLQFSGDGINYVDLGPSFNFVQPTATPATSALPGNNATNRQTGLGGEYVPPAVVAPGATFYLRWHDANDSGTDPVLALDDFTLSATLTNWPALIGISSPTNGQAFPYSSSVTITATNYGTVTNVAFFVDGVLATNDNAAPFSVVLPMSWLTEGTRTITVIGTNSLGQAAATNSITLLITPNQPPTVAVTNVYSGSVTGLSFLVGSLINAQVGITDDVGITNVLWLVDGVPYGANRTVAPYALEFINPLAGTHTLSAVATDLGGLSTTSAVVNLTIYNPDPHYTLLITNGAEWKYHAATAAPGLDGFGFAWFVHGYDDSAWSNGVAELGAGDAAEYPEKTVIDIGPTGSRYPTIYFRKTFSVTDASMFVNLAVNLLRDDGAVVYLNGQAIWTNNIPSAATNPVIHTTLAGAAASDDGTIYQVLNLLNPTPYLLNGLNTIAVEVHQNSLTSSDLSFDLMLWGETLILPSIVVTSPTNGQSFIENMNASVSASASTYVTNVVFRLNGVPLVEDGAAPFTVILSNLPAGNPIVDAIAFDLFGQSITSAPVTLSVAPNQPPQVAFTNIFTGGATGLTFLVGSVLTNQLAVTDDLAVNQVDFYHNGNLYLSRTSAPLSEFIVNNLLAGSHQFSVIATDNTGRTNGASVLVTVTNPAPQYTLLVTNGSQWKYHASTSEPPVDGASRPWLASDYDDSGWAAGLGELGNGHAADFPHKTAIDIGPTGARYATIYFRKTFSVASPSDYINLVIKLLRDDGAVAYLNGVAVWTNNIPRAATNAITYDLLAAGANDNGTVYQTFNLVAPAPYLLAGLNTLAVEVHQTALNSSDLMFDLMLWGETLAPPSVVLTSPTAVTPLIAGMNVTASAAVSLFVTNVVFRLDGVEVGADDTAPYSITVSNLAAGPRQFDAVAFDSYGQSSTSAVVIVNVAPNQPPVVVITNIFSGAVTGTTFLVGTSITNQWLTSDDLGVTEVALYVNGQPYWTNAGAAQVQFVFNNAPAGTNILLAVATDNTGQIGMQQVEVIVTNPPYALLITNGSSWTYFANTNTGLGTAWQALAFDDSGWSNGPAGFGFDASGAAWPWSTPIDIGPTGARYRTIYFRKVINVAEPSAFSNLVVNVLKDDGAVVYFNGIQVFATGFSNNTVFPVTYDTLGLNSPDGGTVYYQTNVSPAFLQRGQNIIAVEVHQTSVTSSDFAFDLMLWGELGPPVGQRLAASLANGQFTVAWPATATNTTLLYSPSVAAPMSTWTVLPGPYAADNGQFRVSLPANQPLLFFGLRQD